MFQFILGFFDVTYLYGVLSSLFAIFIVWGLRQLYITLIHKSAYSGTWTFNAYDDAMQITHTDSVTFRHNKKTKMITGKALNVFPHKNAWKARKIMGALKMNRLLILSYTDEPIESTSVTHLLLKNNYYFKGYMLRYNISTDEIETIVVDYRKLPKKSILGWLRKRKTRYEV
jgi:hypothetical protein